MNRLLDAAELVPGVGQGLHAVREVANVLDSDDGVPPPRFTFQGDLLPLVEAHYFQPYPEQATEGALLFFCTHCADLRLTVIPRGT